MSIDIRDKARVENRLWDEIEKAHMGMLGVDGGPPRHFQPMTPYCEHEAGLLWFFAPKSADIAQAAAAGRDAMFIVQARDGRFQACIGGRLSASADRARIARFWNAAAQAYFPDGKNDPNLALLRFECRDAEIWLTDAGPLRFAWEVARANLTHTVADLGGKTGLRMS